MSHQKPNHIPNRVLTEDSSSSKNFWLSDRILQSQLSHRLDEDALQFLLPKLENLGRLAATKIDSLSRTADKKLPELIKRSPVGENRDHIEFHPSYKELVDIAAESEMFHLKYDAGHKRRFEGQRHQMGFGLGQIYSMSEIGVFCPLCMTDGAAWLLEKHASEDVKKRLLPRLSSNSSDNFFTGAMFLTEKSGGSDVGRNTTTADKMEGNRYKLNGEKWFCSNVNADVILLLARTDREKPGTRGLSLFLAERHSDADPYAEMDIVRLKDKLGVRSMATGEVVLNDTEAILIGKEGYGFKLMTDMINMSRIYNAAGAVGGMRRALVEAWEYLNHRILFGERAVKKPLIRTKLHELGALYLSNFYMHWRMLQALDHSESGNTDEESRLRVLIPMTKWWTAESAVYMVRECMELQGGNGYIEDFVMPKLMRDLNVLPIWEGSGNVIVLDILRAIEKSDGLKLLISDIEKTFAEQRLPDPLVEKWQTVLELLEKLNHVQRDEMEATAKPLFRDFIQFYQLHLLIKAGEHSNDQPWLYPARRYLEAILVPETDIVKPINIKELNELIAWEY